MSAFQRPEGQGIPLSALREWWSQQRKWREQSRRDRMQRGHLSPHFADRDARFERAIAELIDREAASEPVLYASPNRGGSP